MYDTTQSLNQNSFPSVFDLDSLITETFEPINWAVEGMLPEGCILFAGRPKLGKSWFVLQLALAVASGENAFGDFPVNRGEVLYLALEDTRRRLQSRVKQLLADSPLPSGFKMAIEWPRFDEGGAHQLERWLERYPETRMVVVDTFQKIKSRRGHNGDFDTLARLTHIAHEFNICLLVVHHTRKTDADDPFDTVSGATSTTSLADAMLVLKRARCSQDAELHITGRDIEESRKALRFDTESMNWKILGDPDVVWKSQQREDIIDLLRKTRTSMHPADISDALNKSDTAVRKTLSRMVRANQIVWLKGGLYEIKDEDRDPDDPQYIKYQERKQKTKEVLEIISNIYGPDNLDSNEYENLVLSEQVFVHIERAYGNREPDG
jgi:RecA-family ATPase